VTFATSLCRMTPPIAPKVCSSTRGSIVLISVPASSAGRGE
jgi:hypothetical protein